MAGLPYTLRCLTAFGLLLFLAFFISLESDRSIRAQEPKKPRVEEEEEPEKSKVPLPPDAAQPKAGPAKFEIAREAARAKQPFVRQFLQNVSTPFDLLVPARGAQSYKIALMPERTLPDGKFSYFELNNDLSGGNRKELPTGAGFSLIPFEEVVLDEIDKLIDLHTRKKVGGYSRDDIDELGVQVLQVVRRWHATKVEQKIRIGKEWEAVDQRLRQRLVQIRKEQLKASIDGKNWRRADEIALDLANYPEEPAARREILKLLLRKAIESLVADREEDYLNLRDAVNQFENTGGGAGDDLAKSARQLLSRKAAQYADLAGKQAEANQNTAAFGLLKNAESLDPELPAIQTLRSKLRDRVLYVGVPHLPVHMSPATARSDSERWASDLLFESLVQAVPDAEIGRRYRPELAAALPTLVPLGREFTLVKNARWAGDGGKTVDARDVLGTLELLKQLPTLPCSEGIDAIDTDQLRIDDPSQVRLMFRQGVLDPLGRSTFPILPARYLKANGKRADDDQFGRQPFGSGPYRYDGREQEGPNREVAVFRANPYYSQRPGKFGQPNIREIRMVVADPSRAGAEVAAGQLHLLLDVPTGEVGRYRDDPQAGGQLRDYTLQPNRRIQMLAINHRRGALQNVELRRGLSAAIDREGTVKDVFRPEGAKQHHFALTGPFPLNSWATPTKARLPEAALFNRPLASGLLGAAAGKSVLKLTLKYSADDPLAGRACGRIKDQIEAASRKTPNDAPQVEMVLEPLPLATLLRKVEQEHDFDLAYLPFDFRDDLYSLSGYFDPTAAGIFGRNVTGYLAPGSNPQADDTSLRLTMDRIRSHRNFKDNVREDTWKLHQQFLNRMPFIPLWQLDRHILVHKGLELSIDGEKLEPSRLDPRAVFSGVEGWRLK